MTKYPTTHDVLETAFLAVNKAYFDVVEGLGDPTTWVQQAAAEVSASAFSLTIHESFKAVAHAYIKDLVSPTIKLPTELNKLYDIAYPLLEGHATITYDLDRNYDEDISVARQVANLLPMTGDVDHGLSILLVLLNTRRHDPITYGEIKKRAATYEDYQVLSSFYSFERRRKFVRAQRIASSSTTGTGYTRMASLAADAFASSVGETHVTHSWYKPTSQKALTPLFLVFDIKAQRFALHATA